VSTPIKNIAGQRFGRLIVVEFDAVSGKRTCAKWKCVCDCGNTVITRGDNLRSGATQSCGCLRKEMAAASNSKRLTIHGQTAGGFNSKTYRVWANMVTRCTNPKASNFAYYGGRGIALCDEWRSFGQFLRDMGECPERGSIDRIDNSGPYSKANCRWATKVEQANNKRNNRRLVIGGDAMTMSEAARRYGIPVGTIWSRLKLGWTDERAATMPPRSNAWAAEQPEMQEETQ
jgi:hypothetical protein